MKFRIIIRCLLLFLFQWSTVFASEPATVFDGYLKTLKDGQWQEAKGFWRSIIVEKSERLGIEFKDIDVKYDCASPVIQYLEGIRAGLVAVQVVDVRREEDWALLEVQLSSISDKLTSNYYAESDGKGWKLTSPVYLFTRDWRQKPSRFTNIYYNDETQLNQYAITATDDFIEETCKAMGMSEDKVSALAATKIDYFLGRDDDIKKLTGFATRGMGILPFDALVTQYLPHAHELSHLLVNYNLEKVPLYTLPFLQEGIACYFGGRWGRSKEVIAYTGYISLGHDLCQLGDILTFDDFYNTIGSTEISYPVSGLFVGYLIEKLGWVDFLRLYETLSGSDQMISAWNTDYVRKKIMGAGRVTWEEIAAEFDNYWRQFEFAGIQPAKRSPTGDADFRFADEGIEIAVWGLDGIYSFEIRLAPDKSQGSMIFGPGGENPLGEYRSDLFARHHPQIEYRGEHFGLNFSQAEIGMYDYYTDELRAKFVPSLSMDSPSGNEESGILRFELNRDFLPVAEPEDWDVIIISQ